MYASVCGCTNKENVVVARLKYTYNWTKKDLKNLNTKENREETDKRNIQRYTNIKIRNKNNGEGWKWEDAGQRI
jgi:hypothetical protein